MTVERSSLRRPVSLPASDAGVTGGSPSSTDDASDAALTRGFKRVPEAEAAEEAPVVPPSPGGFLGRPRGWDR
jgi:hypothetical protein